MKATELMIGDWVKDITPCRVIQINEKRILLYDNKPHYDCDYGFEYGVNKENFYSIEPILLTPEILEENEWEHSYEKNTSGELHKWHKEDGFKQFTVWKNKGRFELGNLGCFPFKYVHELQHALRLCGLNELANNFRI